ncbi:MAG: chorismate synthase [Candidatus Gastranaerophilaceae bacterium]
MTKFRFLTSGESHGKCLNAIIEGVPAGFKISEDFINNELKRRQVGYGRGKRMQIESDTCEIKSGVRFGRTTGAPICLEIVNKDFDNWRIPMSVKEVDLKNRDILKLVAEKSFTKVRPGHADFAGAIKYQLEDLRDVLERSSARQTAIEVAVGAIAKSILKEFFIIGFSHVTQIGNIKADVLPQSYTLLKESAEHSELRCADDIATDMMKEAIDKAKNDGDTLGGKFEVIFGNLPVGLGSHVHWDRKIDGKIAQAIMSIPAVKSVEIGIGAEAAELRGSKTHDEVFIADNKIYRKTNNAGGIEGGMTNGEPIVVKAVMKAIPTLRTPLKTVDLYKKEQTEAHFERSDTCAVPACAVVAEARIAWIIAEEFLEKFGGDSLNEIKKNYEKK